jgi:ribosomal protein S12 methylthiotransferase accessory factor
MAALGISRVTDITRLDRLGLPVFASIRPRGLSLRVHAGKGFTAVDARAGALMEAVEFAVGELATEAGPDVVMPLRALAAQFPAGLRPFDFAPRLGVELDVELPTPAVACEDISTGTRCLLPADLVWVPNFSDPRIPSIYGRSTTGLASGNSLDEATLHALLEVLERDAIAMNRARDASVRLAEDSMPPPFDALATEWRQLGIDLIVRFVPNEFSLPCFEAVLHEAGSFNVNLSGGMGLHLDRGIALARAICEAAQSRLGLIHGGRDDVTNFYRKYRPGRDAARRRSDDQVVAGLVAGSQIPFGATPSIGCQSVRQALTIVLKRLADLGFGHAFRCRMSSHGDRMALNGLYVVKVVVPRCEALFPPGSVRMGPRLWARVTEQASPSRLSSTAPLQAVPPSAGRPRLASGSRSARGPALSREGGECQRSRRPRPHPSDGRARG